MKKIWIPIAVMVLSIGLFFLAGSGTTASAQQTEKTPLTAIEALGKALFFDPKLSTNGTQSCATCHGPEVGYTGPDALVNLSTAVYQGALPNHFGNRKPPAAAYAGDSPVLSFNEDTGAWFGGMFWDGRATGVRLGDPLAEQAQGPYLNPLEQALANEQVLCVKVKQSTYAGLFTEVWGAESLNCAKDTGGVYERIGKSVAAYERSAEVNPYSSKFDLFWDNAIAAGKDVTKIKCGTGGGMGGGGMGGGGMMGCPGGGTSPYRWTAYRNLGLTDTELQGLAVFNDPNRANCSSCHSIQPGSAGYPMFTDYGYDNLGVPKNPDNPFYKMPAAWNRDGEAWVDTGLGGFLKNSGYPAEVYEPEMGKMKVPTLRNVDLKPGEGFTKAYGHNGYFKSLEDVVLFYHWRGMMDSGMGCGGMGGGMGDCGGMESMFPPPEVDQNRATLSMFPRMQVDTIVAFLKTLSDGYISR